MQQGNGGTMRWVALLAAASALAAGGADAQGARVAGRVSILERDNKPSPDLGDAVIYLEGSGATARAAAFEVAINNKLYVPHVLVVPVGSTVKFPNRDPFNHNVFSPSEPNQFDLGLYGRNQAKGWTFAQPGLARIYCNVHPRMVSYVIVAANRYFTQPGTDGSFALDSVPPGRYRLHVWHERVAAEVVKDLVVPVAGVTDVAVALNARGYRWQPHKNKYGREYPTNAGRERY
ncbi:MAG: methylamine utilization protein [Gemmatimonadales bacterium]